MVTEQLENKRQPLDANAIYFISPSPLSISLLIQDFSVKHHYQYTAVNIIWNGEIGEEEMERISREEHLVKRINTFQELQLNLVFYGEEVSVLGVERALEVAGEVEMMAKNLFILITCNESINYVYEIHCETNLLCESILSILTELLKGAPKKPFPPSHPPTLLPIIIASRLLDPVSPLFLSPLYSPLFRHLKSIETNHLITGTAKSRNLFYFDSSDPLYHHHHHKHISEISEAIVKDIKQWREQSELSKFQLNKNPESPPPTSTTTPTSFRMNDIT